MIEEHFLIGDGWSGWLRFYPNEQYHFVVHSCSNDHAEDLQLLKTGDEVEQYLDELDQKWGDFPARVPLMDYFAARYEADGE